MKTMIVPVVLALLALAGAEPQFLRYGYSSAYSAGLPVAWNNYPLYSQRVAAVTPLSYAAPAAVSPLTYAAPVAASSRQYHAQDELGQASFGYSHPGQASATFQDAYGNQVGSYAYIDPNGKEVRVSYVADSNGFRVLSNALPVAPAAPAVALPVGPAPVQDTAEVVEARAAHLAAVAAAKSRNKRDVSLSLPAYRYASLGYNTPLIHNAPLAYSAPSWGYNVAAPAAAYAAAPLAYSAPSWGYNVATPAAAYAAAPLTYAAAAPAAAYTAAPLTYAAAAPAAVREATLTKIVHNPNHAVSYRVD